MEGDRSQQGDQPAVDPGGTERKTFGTKPYLDKEGRELLNRAAEQIQRDMPEYVSDPRNPSASDCLKWLKDRNGEYLDSELMVNLLAEGLTAEESLVWLLWQHSGLSPREIFYAHEGKETAGRSGVDRQAIRNIHARIRTAAMKLGVDVDAELKADLDALGGEA